MLKYLITFLFVPSAATINAQCTTCNSFSEALKNPEQVTAIKINGFQHSVTLSEIPADISKFINLKILWLSSHEIKTINQEVCKLESLQSLSLAENQLPELPDCIYELKNLKELILINNEFSDETKAAIKKRFSKSNPGAKIMLDM